MSESEPISADAGAAERPTPSSAPRPGASVRVVLALAAVGLFFAAMVAVLFYRSLYNAPPNPSAMLLIAGGEHCRGAVVTIEGPGATYRNVLSPENRYTWRRLLPAGAYAVRVELGGKVIHETLYTRLDAGQIGNVTLPPPRTRPATAPRVP